jgi:histidinol phosphatase-like PHP family hydrolase
VASLTNAQLAELLADLAENSDGIRRKALKRAARSAFLWPEEAADLLATEHSLTELHGVGPFIARELQRWIEAPPATTRRSDSLRKDFLTRAEARRILARDPSWARRLRGDIHMHTTWSDGSGTVGETVEAGRERGYEYIAITDHSKGLKIAGGIDETQISAQGAEIEQLNKSGAFAGITAVRSIELNLNPRGQGDLESDCLARLDLVLGSFHSALRSKEDQTARYLAALRNPALHILGHPRGRVYNYRLGLTADWPRVFAEAAALDRAVEVDCYPDRQDLNVALLKLARESGCRIALGTDSHHSWQLEFIDLGLAAVLKAKIPADRVINFLPLSQLREWIASCRFTATRIQE